MKTPRSTFFAALAISLAVTGCSGGGKPGGVTETIVDFRPTEASLAEGRAVMKLRFTNENVSPLGFSSSTHKLYLNGSYVGKAVGDQPFGIPPLNSVTQDETVHLENVALVRQLMASRDTQTAAYRLESVLFQTIYEDKYQIKIQANGSVDLRESATAVK